MLVILGELGRVVLVSVRLVRHRLTRVAVLLLGIGGNRRNVPLTLTAHVLQVAEVEHLAQRRSAFDGNFHLASLHVLVAAVLPTVLRLLLLLLALRESVHFSAQFVDDNILDLFG